MSNLADFYFFIPFTTCKSVCKQLAFSGEDLERSTGSCISFTEASLALAVPSLMLRAGFSGRREQEKPGLNFMQGHLQVQDLFWHFGMFICG